MRTLFKALFLSFIISVCEIFFPSNASANTEPIEQSTEQCIIALKKLDDMTQEELKNCQVSLSLCEALTDEERQTMKKRLSYLLPKAQGTFFMHKYLTDKHNTDYNNPIAAMNAGLNVGLYSQFFQDCSGPHISNDPQEQTECQDLRDQIFNELSAFIRTQQQKTGINTEKRINHAIIKRELENSSMVYRREPLKIYATKREKLYYKMRSNALDAINQSAVQQKPDTYDRNAMLSALSEATKCDAEDKVCAEISSHVRGELEELIRKSQRKSGIIAKDERFIDC